MELNKLINENTIELDLIARDKDEAIDLMIGILERDGVIKNKDKFKRDIYLREALSNTGIGFGIAIPHAKSKFVKEPRIAIGILRNSIEYGSIDESPVNLIFMIAVNEKQSDLHLKALANLSRKLIYQEFREKIINSNSKKEILEII